jgi:hypothetical protein
MRHLNEKILNLATAAAAVIVVGMPVQLSAADLVATKTKELAGRTYTFEKWADTNGGVKATILDEKGNKVVPRRLPQMTRTIIQPELERFLQKRDDHRGMVKVNVTLNIPYKVAEGYPQTGAVAISKRGKPQRLQLNGRRISMQTFARIQASEQDAHRAESARRFKERNIFVQAFAKRHDLQLAKDALEASVNTLTFELNSKKIRDLANSGDSSILGIELFQEPQISGAEGMTNSGINPWALDNTLARGSGIGIYWTEIGCPDEDDIDSLYTRLSGTTHWHSEEVGEILRDVSPESTLYCRADWTFPTQSDLTELNPSVDIVNQSGGFKGQTVYGTGDRDSDDFVYDELIPWFNSAGNAGNSAGNIDGIGQALNVVTVGNYSDDTDTMDTASSFVDPSTGNDKPEIVAPGDATSWASPHAAGFSADSMAQSTWQKNKPHLVKAKQLAGATDEIAGDATEITMWGIPEKMGTGGIDFLSSHYNGWNYWMHSDNGSFSTLDAADGAADGYITREVYISSAHDAVRIAMSWLIRGTYVYTNKDDAHPIGMDLDLSVYDPNGNLVGRSWSWDNGFEVVDFEPTRSGTYSFKINRFANRDLGNKLRVGVAVNFYND